MQLALLICYFHFFVVNSLSFHDILHVDLGRAIDVTFSFLFLNSSDLRVHSLVAKILEFMLVSNCEIASTTRGGKNTSCDI